MSGALTQGGPWAAMQKDLCPAGTMAVSMIAQMGAVKEKWTPWTPKVRTVAKGRKACWIVFEKQNKV